MRLIDADRLKAVLEKNFGHTGGASVLEQLIDDQPTIQPQSTMGQLNDGSRSTAQSTDLIDRQAALDIFDDYNVSVENGELEAYSRDRKRLCDLPPIQPVATDTNVGNNSEIPNSSDAVSRQAAIDALTAAIDDVGILDGADIKVVFDNLPSAQPEPHEGKWVYGEDFAADCVDGYRCSQCGFFVPWDYNHKLIDYINDYAYCPKCGAKMSNQNKIKGERQK